MNNKAFKIITKSKHFIYFVTEENENKNWCLKIAVKNRYKTNFKKAIVEGFSKTEDDYQNYGKALCKLFPVASTGSDSNIILEILYNCELLYRKYKPNNDFDEIINLYVSDDKLFGLYTIILTLNRLIRTYFNDDIFIKEVDAIFDSFSYLFIIYLVLSVLLEIVIFFILNFCVISDVRKTNKLLGDFMSSLKF